MLQKTRCLCTSFALFWLLLWGLYGTFLGLEQRTYSFHHLSAQQLSKTLFSLAHAHMNTMAIGLMAILGQIHLLDFSLRRWAFKALGLYILGMCFFGVGLVIEGLWANTQSVALTVGFVSASLGAMFYLLSLCLFLSLFFISSQHKTQS